MLIYDQEFSVSTFTLLDGLFSDYVRQEILDIVESNPTSRFCCQIDDKDPNTYIYLIEHNQAEAYTLCHFFRPIELETIICIKAFLWNIYMPSSNSLPTCHLFEDSCSFITRSYSSSIVLDSSSVAVIFSFLAASANCFLI